MATQLVMNDAFEVFEERLLLGENGHFVKVWATYQDGRLCDVLVIWPTKYSMETCDMATYWF